MKTAIGIIIAIGVGVIVLVVGMWRQRRRERNEVARFKGSFHMDAQDYAAAMGFRAGTHEAEVAIKLRSIIAEYGQIPAESVLPEHKFWEYKNLPFFDSPDTIELIMTIEEQFEVHILDEEAEGLIAKVFDYFEVNKDLTIKGMTARFLEVLKGLEKKDGGIEK